MLQTLSVKGGILGPYMISTVLLVVTVMAPTECMHIVQYPSAYKSLPVASVISHSSTFK